MSEPFEPRILVVPSEDAMFEFLTALNVSGETPELSCSSKGMSFLAGLTEPDADYVHITATAADTGRAHCCECEHPGVFRADQGDPNTWSPTYPVHALVTTYPDMKRVREEGYIEVWWES